ncbi:MAG TPA: hypothetical protein PKE55_15150, partial [Kiritimatiellia bacterium]|nr:hypothetical protein [Kiritimatiellia bacterium]
MTPSATCGIRVFRPAPGAPPAWQEFRDPTQVLSATRHEDVLSALATAQQWQEQGAWVIGWVAYEAGPAFEPALPVRPDSTTPLAWFARFTQPILHSALPVPFAPDQDTRLDWQPTQSLPDYRNHIQTIRDAIARGETYQVNYTFFLNAPPPPHPPPP